METTTSNAAPKTNGTLCLIVLAESADGKRTRIKLFAGPRYPLLMTQAINFMQQELGDGWKLLKSKVSGEPEGEHQESKLIAVLKAMDAKTQELRNLGYLPQKGA